MFAKDRNGNDFIKLIGKASYHSNVTLAAGTKLDINFQAIDTAFIAVYSDNIYPYSYVTNKDVFSNISLDLTSVNNDGYLDIGTNLFPYLYETERLQGIVVLNDTNSDIVLRIRGNNDSF